MIHSFLRRYKRGYYRLCSHRSRWGLKCYRPFCWDGYCRKHILAEMERETEGRGGWGYGA